MEKAAGIIPGFGCRLNIKGKERLKRREPGKHSGFCCNKRMLCEGAFCNFLEDLLFFVVSLVIFKS